MIKRIIAFTLASHLSLALCAEVRPASIYSDGMVVQRDRPFPLRGTAAPGEEVTVRIDDVTIKNTVADADGRWSVTLDPLETGRSYDIIIADKIIHDVVAGDVLLCSGQSNMELPVRRVTDMFADEIATSRPHVVRQFIVPKEFDFDCERTDVGTSRWNAADEDVMSFSALAYFTALSLHERTGLPVGIINASWGGTPVEAWISEPYLAPWPRHIATKKIYESESYRKAIKSQEGRDYSVWNSVADATDPGLCGSMKFYMPEYDDSGWTETELFSNDWATDGLNPRNGTHWFRKTVTFDSIHANLPATLRLGCIVDADSVWVNGRKVGFTSYQYPPRIYNIPVGLLSEGENVVTVRLISQHGFPSFVPEKPYKIVFGDRPYAVYGQTLPDELPLEGPWRYHSGAPMPPGPSMEFFCYKPSVLYNAMIAPVIDYPVTGTVWYQGESNVSRHNEYSSLLQTLMSCWRDAASDPAMPFYIVELADFLHPSDTVGRAAWTKLREAQADAVAATEGAALIRNSDLGEWNDIHPLDKKTLGTRVADAIFSRLTNHR